jgi:hypothetical protein
MWKATNQAGGFSGLMLSMHRISTFAERNGWKDKLRDMFSERG